MKRGFRGVRGRQLSQPTLCEDVIGRLYRSVGTSVVRPLNVAINCCVLASSATVAERADCDAGRRLAPLRGLSGGNLGSVGMGGAGIRCAMGGLTVTIATRLGSRHWKVLPGTNFFTSLPTCSLQIWLRFTSFTRADICTPQTSVTVLSSQFCIGTYELRSLPRGCSIAPIGWGGRMGQRTMSTLAPKPAIVYRGVAEASM
jgi:hypothetical protein